MRSITAALACFLFFLAAIPATAQPLLPGFTTPPDSVKPSVYWYWIDNLISADGVQKDIAAMSQIGIGRAFIGNVGFGRHEMGLDYGPDTLFSPAWWRVTTTALRAGDRYGVNIGIFNSPGWSQSGGPWIKPSSAMRYLASEEITISGPGPITHHFEDPPDFQPVTLLAFPTPAGATDSLSEQNIPFGTQPDTTISLEAPAPLLVRSLSLFPQHEPVTAHLRLLARVGERVDTLADFDFDRSNPALNTGFLPWAPVVVSFPATTAQQFRLVLTGIHGHGGFSRITLSGAARTSRYIEKQLGKMFSSPLPMWSEYQWPDQTPITDAQTLVNPSAVLDLSNIIGADNTLRWSAPPGNWTLLRMGMRPTGVTNSPATPEGTGLDVDKLSPVAVDRHFDAFIGRILQTIPAADRRAFKFVVADSYETGSQNWTDDLATTFRHRYQYDPLPWLPVLRGYVVGSPDASDRFLWDLRRLVADKVADDYVGELRRVSNRNGLHLWLENYGHWGFPSEFLLYGGQSDEVGGEFWAEGALGSIECRDASSAAHIYGRSLVSAESFTAAGNAWGRYPALLKKRGDWSFTEGINNTLFHLYIHQPDDRKPGVAAWFGTEFNRHNTWFRQGKAFIDYIRRCNFMLRQGLPVDDIAYFIGEDAPRMTGIRDPQLPAGYQFDYINSDVILHRLSVKQGRLTLPDGMSYRLLVLPKLETMRPELLRTIARLVAQGATILGTPPRRSPSRQGGANADNEVMTLAASLWSGLDGTSTRSARHGQGFVLQGMTIPEAMDFLHSGPDFISNTTAPILYTHRHTKTAEIYFLSNQGDSTARFTASFRVTNGLPRWCDAVTGASRPLPDFHHAVGYTEIPITLPPTGSGFLVFANETTPATTTKENFPAPSALLTLDSSWTVRFDTAMGGPRNPVVFPALTDWSTNPNDSIRNYSGTAVYTTHFRLPHWQKGQEVYIDLGAVKVIANIKLNGKLLGTAWTSPWRLNATKAIATGLNTLEIAVTNTWVNRLIGDSGLPAGRRLTWSNMQPYQQNSPLDPSGLGGPVTILTLPY